MSRRARRTRATPATAILGTAEVSLLDVVDNVLNKGVVLTGELTLALADVDLIYARLSLLLCAADRVLGPASRRSGTISRPASPGVRRRA